MECLTCRSNSGERRISPGPTIYAGRYWNVEHAYPVKMAGWLVLVLKRHAEALHELSEAEFEELAALQKQAAYVLHEVFGCAKEYAICFGEAEGFPHIHFHVVARAPDLPEGLKGAQIFKMIKATEAEAVPPAEIRAFCEDLQRRFAQPLG